MRPSEFEHLREVLPLHTVSFQKFDNSYFGIVEIPGEQKPRAVVRRLEYEQDYTRLSEQFDKLSSHGINVAQCSPFYADDGSLFIATEYIEGPRYDEWAQRNDHTNTSMSVISHALNLANYFTEQIAANDNHLSDIVSTFQYRVTDERGPVLVDLDTSAEGFNHLNPDRTVKERHLRSYLVDIGVEYGKYLPSNLASDLRIAMNTRFQLVTGKSLLQEGTDQFD